MTDQRDASPSDAERTPDERIADDKTARETETESGKPPHPAPDETPEAAPSEESAVQTHPAAASEDAQDAPLSDAADHQSPQPPSPEPTATPTRPERPEVTALRRAQESQEPMEGKVIGWNKGGLHVVIGGVTAFCPRSEIERGAPKDPQSYVDREFPFQVLKVQKRGRRVVVSRRALAERAQRERIEELRARMKSGEILEGRVSSLTDFGAFVDLGGIDGLVHVSEISLARISHPSEKVAVGDQVKVKIIKIGDAGRRVSLSMKALEDDPWSGIEKRFPVGEIVPGVVERTADFGAFVEIAPGVTGLLPTAAMNIPRGASPGRIYHPGREVSVQITGVDKRRRRLSLALEGSQMEGTHADLKTYLESQGSSTSGFGTLAAAFGKVKSDDD